MYGSAGVDFAVGDITHVPVGDGSRREISRVVLTRTGELALSVDVLFHFEDGRVIRKRWDGLKEWVRYEFAETARLDRVVVDPGFKVALDTNLANNSRVLDPADDYLSGWQNLLRAAVQHLWQLLSLGC